MSSVSREILVLYHEESDQRTLPAILGQSPFSTITTSNTLEALKFLHKGRIDLIIVCLGAAFDWNTVSTLRSACRKAPILAILPGNSEIDPREVLQAGVWKILMSPFEEEELSNILKKLAPPNKSIYPKNTRINE
jgi:DNA-binding response OmpR family regulator